MITIDSIHLMDSSTHLSVSLHLGIRGVTQIVESNSAYSVVNG